MASRSSSPKTPDASDEPHNLVIHNDLPSWCHTLAPLQTKAFPVTSIWEGELSPPAFDKDDDERMLELSDLIDEQAYDDSPPSGVEHSPLFSCPPSDANCSETTAPLDSVQPSAQPSPQRSEYHLPSPTQLGCTPIMESPTVRPRKRDLGVVPRQVICPPRESCRNLVILTPNIPRSGTKSRVETQIRVTVDLAHGSSSAGELCQYDRVGSWKWLRLPPGTATKRRTRREGKIDPALVDILHLTATVTCASAPYSPVAKRVARKLAARVRPARSDSDGTGNGNERSKGVREDTTSIIQFNCPEILDFSSGSAVLPVRITCYCRHHREKVGFNVHLTMVDHSGRIVGTGMTPPIMITDDHKSTVKAGAIPSPSVEEETWSKVPAVAEPMEPGAPPKNVLGKTKNQTNKRAKPYDTTNRSNNLRFSREASVTSLGSSVGSPSAGPTVLQSTPPHAPRPPSPSRIQLQSQVSAAAEVLTLPVDGQSLTSAFALSGGHTSPPLHEIAVDMFTSSNSVSMRQSVSSITTIPSSIAPGTLSAHVLCDLVAPQTMPDLFYGPASQQSLVPPSTPIIHRLIPSTGPTYGGIEVTVLGENFHLPLTCVFGDVPASSTQRWGNSTLLCLLPPQATPGKVTVWFDGFDKTREVLSPPIFTYADETDRALMELALRVVGLKMTGKIEDAKDVAWRIVGSPGSEDMSLSGSPGNAMQIMSTVHEIRSLVSVRSGDNSKFEANIVNLLSLASLNIPQRGDMSLAATLSHTTPTGQTLLHLAVFLNLAVLTEFLIAQDIDLDARDRNGYTALHFAALAQSKTCAALLIRAGADPEIVNALGKTAHDIAPARFFDIIQHHDTPDGELTSSQSEDDGESQWGDIETDEDTSPVARRKQIPRFVRRGSNRRIVDANKESLDSESLIPPRNGTKASREDKNMKNKDPRDEKQAASFVDVIQRTVSQLHAQGIIPNMPQLPLHLPEIPAVPWAALPQIPLVFPVFVPMPGWPSFLSEKREGPQGTNMYDKDRDGGSNLVGYSAMRTAQEILTTWEKLIGMAAVLRPQTTEEPPPMYTPRELDLDNRPTELVASTSQVTPETDSQGSMWQPGSSERTSRRAGYQAASVTAQDVDSYGYVPSKSQIKKTKQKYDRMLVLFWLPILLMSLLWAFHNGVRFVLQTLKTTLFVKAGVRT
ncbi:hypothetical protein ID866_3512 [Astraeus odoratus]|nr:hypothetical protein ID866_3512 [Astraeus odoratus]